MAPKQGLIVTVSPSASAYFAGELFNCTITFANPAPRPSPPPSTSQHQHPYDFYPSPPPTFTGQAALPPGRRRPPSASHLGLADYDTRHLDSDEMPASPYVGSGRNASDAWGSTPSLHSRSASMAATTMSTPSWGGPSAAPTPRPHHQKRPSFSSSASGSASANPNLGGFTPQPSWTMNHRSASGLNTSLPSSTNSLPIMGPKGQPLPTRKGLIGKPLPPPAAVPPLAPSTGTRGIYPTGPRRPGALSRSAHGRTLSMAVSSPNLATLAAGPKGDQRSTSIPNPISYPVPQHERTSSIRREGNEDEASPPDSPIFDGSLPPSRSTSSALGPNFGRPSSNPQQNPMYPFSPAREAAGTHPPNDRDSDEESDYDPNDSRSTLPGHGFYGIGRNETMDHLVKQDLEAAYTREVSTSYGSNDSSGTLVPPPLPPPPRFDRVVPPPPKSGTVVKKPPPFAYPDETISLLWSFAHLEGTFEVDEALVKPGEFNLLKQELSSGPGAAVGGGTLDDTTGRQAGGGSGGWTSWIWGAGGGGSESAGTRTGMAGGMIANAGMLGEGPKTLQERKEKSLKEKSIPTFSSPPSILGVDLVLEPEESKSYTFTIRIPADLPPSFRGKSIKFSYHLVVGTNRSNLGGINSTAARLGAARNSTSRVIKVPVRVYNHVGVTGARPFYDLTNPIVYHRDEATVQPVNSSSDLARSTSLAATRTTRLVPESAPEQHKLRRRLSNGRRDFEAYATTLLDSVRLASPELVAKASMSPTLHPLQSPTAVTLDGLPAFRPERTDRHASGAGYPAANGGDADQMGVQPHTGALGSVGIVEEEENAGCKAAVEIVTRNSQKVSYDINKDGFMVAQLTLVKSAYRLGETVNGSVVINSGEGRVLRISARLETHELIETSISTKPAPQVRALTRRLHAEHHEMTLDSARVGFALAIPSGATPDFGTSGVKLQWSVRLSFLVMPPSPDAPRPSTQPGHARRGSIFPGRGGVPPPPPPPPSSKLANGGRSHTRSKSFAYGFEPTVPLTLPAPPAILPTGAAHLMPVLGPRDTSTSHVSYRAVPDLGFAPVLYSTHAPEAPPSPGPLQRSASGKGLHQRGASSISSPRGTQVVAVQQTSVVLVPAKVEMVECSIPIKVYPGNTPFRPTISVFAA